MGDEKVRAHATVRIEVELTESVWGDDCQINQVYRQAARGAVDQIRNGLAKALQSGSARIIGEPVVTAVLVPEKR